MRQNPGIHPDERHWRSKMRLVPAAVFLLSLMTLSSCEVGRRYRVKAEKDLVVSKKQIGSYSGEGLRYRISAVGVNGCCTVDLQLQNLTKQKMALRPAQAKISSNCGS